MKSLADLHSTLLNKIYSISYYRCPLRRAFLLLLTLQYPSFRPPTLSSLFLCLSSAMSFRTYISEYPTRALISLIGTPGFFLISFKTSHPASYVGAFSSNSYEICSCLYRAKVTYSPSKHCFGWSFFSLKTPDGDSINELSPLAQRHRRLTPSCFRFSQEFLSLSW